MTMVLIQPERTFHPLAAVCAWLLPGLGHIIIGQKKRGGLIMFGVLFLFVTGLLVGGVDCVDRKNDRLWFFAQAVCGPLAFVADFANHTYTKNMPPDWNLRYQQNDPEILEMLRRTSLGRANEMGTLFCALAGLMNLVVILDALCPIPRHETVNFAQRGGGLTKNRREDDERAMA